MSLSRSPLLYVFLDCHDIPRERELIETVFRLPVVEIEPHQPHHRHGVVKYDAGEMILSLNLSTPRKFRPERSDALLTVLSVDPEWSIPQRLVGSGRVVDSPSGATFTDHSGHHFAFRDAPELACRRTAPAVQELQLSVDDLDASLEFYGQAMGLEVIDRSRTSATCATGSVPLVLERAAHSPDGRVPQHNTYLLVFHTADVAGMRDALEKRGVTFPAPRAAYSDIGGTIRFEDPSGHRICLYEPSEESLTWGSGPKVLEIVGGNAIAH